MGIRLERIILQLFSNEIDIKGLIATTSCWHKTRVDPESIEKVIKAYGKVQPNLIKHETGFPNAEALLMLVKQGKFGQTPMINIPHIFIMNMDERFERTLHPSPVIK